jgi:hypothetical protein
VGHAVSFLIALSAILVCTVTWCAFAAIWIIKQLKWLRAVLVPWMVEIRKLIESKQQ